MLKIKIQDMERVETRSKKKEKKELRKKVKPSKKVEVERASFHAEPYSEKIDTQKLEEISTRNAADITWQNTEPV